MNMFIQMVLRKIWRPNDNILFYIGILNKEKMSWPRYIDPDASKAE